MAGDPTRDFQDPCGVSKLDQAADLLVRATVASRSRSVADGSLIAS